MISLNPDYTWRTFPNKGYLTVRYSEEEINPIKQEILKIQENFFAENLISHNKNLAGNLVKEFKLTECKDYVEKLILPHVYNYQNEFNISEMVTVNTKECPVVLDTLWVNFQEKYEFNPIHNHSGILSFVIWITIPYDIETEKSQGPGRKSNMNVPGHFFFSYTNSLGVSCQENIPADKTFENHMFLFPSALRHGVYPFYTSDEYRISISGNFKFDVDNKSK